MARRGTSDTIKTRVASESDGSPIKETKRPDNWNTVKERAMQQLTALKEIELKAVGQIQKEIVNLSIWVAEKPGCLCQLDRQYLRAKLTLITAKIEASESADLQRVALERIVNESATKVPQ